MARTKGANPSNLRLAWSQSDVTAVKVPNRCPPPVSVRFTKQQRQCLAQEAGDLPLSVYIRSQVFGDDGVLRRRRVQHIQDAKAIAQILSLLGQSGVFGNLDQLAKCAANGALPVTPDICSDLEQACVDIREIGSLLLKALGTRKVKP